MNDKKREVALEELKAKVNDLIAPGSMTRGEAIEFLEDLVSDFQTQIDCMCEEEKRGES